MTRAKLLNSSTIIVYDREDSDRFVECDNTTAAISEAKTYLLGADYVRDRTGIMLPSEFSQYKVEYD